MFFFRGLFFQIQFFKGKVDKIKNRKIEEISLIILSHLQVASFPGLGSTSLPPHKEVWLTFRGGRSLIHSEIQQPLEINHTSSQ